MLRSSCESWVGEMCSKLHLWHPGDQELLLAKAGPGSTLATCLGLELALGLARGTGSCPGTHWVRGDHTHGVRGDHTHWVRGITPTG